MTLAPSNYPLGFKDTLAGGDIPVTWTNTKYKMIYTNMGHGNQILTTHSRISSLKMLCCGSAADVSKATTIR